MTNSKLISYTSKWDLFYLSNSIKIYRERLQTGLKTYEEYRCSAFWIAWINIRRLFCKILCWVLVDSPGLASGAGRAFISPPGELVSSSTGSWEGKFRKVNTEYLSLFTFGIPVSVDLEWKYCRL